MASKCFEMKSPSGSTLALLILVDRLCFDRHKIDYTSSTVGGKSNYLSEYENRSRLCADSRGAYMDPVTFSNFAAPNLG